MEKEEEKDPQPLTDEELADYQKKEERKVWFLGSIIDFIVSFFLLICFRLYSAEMLPQFYLAFYHQPHYIAYTGCEHP